MAKRKYLHKIRRKKSKSINFLLKNKNVDTKRETFFVSNGRPITWLKLEVLKLQSQLAVALREKDYSRSKSIIRKILRSDLAQQLAVYKTISSTGSRSKGIRDNERLVTRAQYETLRQELWSIIKNPAKYNATPLKRIWLPKNNTTELRAISIPSYIDRALQHLHLFALEVISEEFADTYSFGFRPYRSPGWAAKALTLQVWSRKGFGPPKYALELDISKCFDSISHEFIINLLTKYNFNGETFEIIHPNIVKQWLECGHVDFRGMVTPQNQIIPTESGIPQGGPISPTIANMVLDGIEKHVKSSLPPVKTADVLHINSWDKVVWLYEGKEIICTTNIDISRSTIINATLRAAGYAPPKAMARLFYNGTWPHRRGPWSYKKLDTSNSILDGRTQINNAYLSIFRYADDIVILLNRVEMANKVMDLINVFLSARGLNINKEKTKLKNLHNGDKINFVGFEFAVTEKDNQWKVYNYPPSEKIANVKLKIKDTFKTYKFHPYTAFYIANAILRGWLNFYRTGNSKKAFQNLHEWLFKQTYKYLITYLRNKDPKKYRISSQRYKKKLVHFDFKNTFFSSKWFSIPQSLNPNTRWSKKDGDSYMLISPKSIEVSTPSILVGLSAFHPDDRFKLNARAIYWKSGLLKSLLIKSKGICKNCNCDLLVNTNTFEVHHMKPIKLGGGNRFTNLAVLCSECHKAVTKAVKTKNIEEILLYESSKILLNVSEILLSVTPPET
jgi:retron-type reverse transcriptase